MRRASTRRAVLAAACLMLAAVTAGGCSGTGGSTDNGRTTHAGSTTAGQGTPPPQPQQAYAIAQKEFGLLSGGGWAAAWNLWTADAQHAVPQAEFVQVNTACRPTLGVPYVIDDSTVAGSPDTVRIAWHRAGAKGTDTLRYEGGQWRVAPDASTLAGYRLGAEQLIRQRRAAGSCH